MFNVLAQVNWLAVALATVALAVLGGLWFTALFGRTYAVALGREGAPAGPTAPIFIVGPLLCGLVTAVTSAVLMRALGIESYGDALVFGLIVGLGYLAATTVNVAINPNIPRPLLYGLVSGGYFLAASLLISLIVAAMG